MDKASIEKLFGLARVEATPDELERFSGEFQATLDYAAKLKGAPLGDLPPTLSMAPRTNVCREDGVALLQGDTLELLVSQFPEFKEKYLKVKNVFGAK